jgi:hypothetical protein
MNKQLFGLAMLVLIAGVAFVGLVRLDSNTGMFMTKGNMVLSGGLYDKDGYVLYTNKQTRFQKTVNAIVAVAPDGRVIGHGPVYPGQYSLTLYGDWRDYPELYIQIGFYDAARSDRNNLYDCTVLNINDVMNKPGRRAGGSQKLDLYCDMSTMQKASTMRYR